MVKNSFSTTWKKSKQVRKQRKYRYNAPLHIKQKFMHASLSPELRKKYGSRNIQVKKDDKVKILRGQFKKKEGNVERINLKQGKVFIVGVEIIKKEGAKIPVAINPSNLMIIDLNLNDKKRKLKLESKKGSNKVADKTEKKVEQENKK